MQPCVSSAESSILKGNIMILCWAGKAKIY